MAREHLSHEEFFIQLVSSIERAQKKGHGSVHMTQKRLTHDLESAPTTPSKVADDPLWDLHPPNPLPLLIRATDGATTKSDKKTKNSDKVKLSTVVQPNDIDAFFVRYAEVCRAGMQSLKKRDRRQARKEKSKKKKGGAAEEKKS